MRDHAALSALAAVICEGSFERAALTGHAADAPIGLGRVVLAAAGRALLPA